MNPKVLVFMGFMLSSLAFLGLAVLLPASLIFQILKLILLALAVLFVIFAFASRYYSYLLIPLVSQHSWHVVINDQVPYWLSSTGDCIVRKSGEDFIATVYMSIPFYLSASEMSDDEKLRFTSQVSRLVGISREPVRFTSELYFMNKDDYIRKLSDTINLVEDEQAKLIESKASEPELERARGKLAMWKKMYDNIINSVSFELVSFASISARGSKEFEAITIAQQHARELMNGIATTLGVPPSIIVGEEILKYVEPEHLIPYSTIRKQISHRIEQGVS
jgi:hypothetical protein